LAVDCCRRSLTAIQFQRVAIFFAERHDGRGFFAFFSEHQISRRAHNLVSREMAARAVPRRGLVRLSALARGATNEKIFGGWIEELSGSGLGFFAAQAVWFFLSLRWHPLIAFVFQASPLCGAAPTFLCRRKEK
jgi:hypothetical protein